MSLLRTRGGRGSGRGSGGGASRRARSGVARFWMQGCAWGPAGRVVLLACSACHSSVQSGTPPGTQCSPLGEYCGGGKSGVCRQPTWVDDATAWCPREGESSVFVQPACSTFPYDVVSFGSGIDCAYIAAY